MLPDRKKGRNTHRHGHLGTKCSCWAYELLSSQVHCRIKLVASESDGDGAFQLVWKPWCVRTDWKTEAHLILKGENLRGPNYCPTLQGWPKEGAEVSSRLRWAMGESDQRADRGPKEGLPLTESSFTLLGQPERMLQTESVWSPQKNRDSSQPGGWMKRPPGSLAESEILH